MRAVLQRVSRAAVTVEGAGGASGAGREVVGRIDAGLLVLLGVGRGDTREDAHRLAEKIVHLRLFPDETGRMNHSLLAVRGALLVVPQFTLYGDCSRGRRPNFFNAAPPDEGERLYLAFVDRLRAAAPRVETGRFRAHMLVELVNDGPVTLLLDSRELGE